MEIVNINKNKPASKIISGNYFTGGKKYGENVIFVRNWNLPSVQDILGL